LLKIHIPTDSLKFGNALFFVIDNRPLSQIFCLHVIITNAFYVSEFSSDSEETQVIQQKFSISIVEVIVIFSSFIANFCTMEVIRTF
jgi:hypothetical protein